MNQPYNLLKVDPFFEVLRVITLGSLKMLEGM